MNTYRAGWYPNFYKGEGPLTCPQTCKLWVGTLSESEESFEMDQQTERTNVCKVTRDEEIILKPINDPKSDWLYGNQFDDYPVCFVHPIGYEPFQSRLFMCECVEKVASCDQPDLIVENIARPVWNGSASVIDVTVRNIGGAASGAFQTVLTDLDTGVDDMQPSAGLAPGAGAVLTFTFSYWVFDPNANLAAMVDSKEEVEECNEDNNKLEYHEKG